MNNKHYTYCCSELEEARWVVVWDGEKYFADFFTILLIQSLRSYKIIEENLSGKDAKDLAEKLNQTKQIMES